jgi:hypothetical protein
MAKCALKEKSSKVKFSLSLEEFSAISAIEGLKLSEGSERRLEANAYKSTEARREESLRAYARFGRPSGARDLLVG